MVQAEPVSVPAMRTCLRSAATTELGWSEVVVRGAGELGQLASEVGRAGAGLVERDVAVGGVDEGKGGTGADDQDQDCHEQLDEREAALVH